MKLQLTKESELAFEQADDGPFLLINQANGISAAAFLALLTEIELFIPDFENAVGLSGASLWIGERLDEAVHAGRTTVKHHLTNQYFSEFEIKSGIAHILMENYELAKTRMGVLTRRYHAYNFTVLRFLVTRLAHEDTHAHIHKTEYSNLFAELTDLTRKEIEEKRPHARDKIRFLPLELTAPIYLKEKEELTARKMQRFALNAFLKRYYERDPDRYSLVGVPLFLPPHPEVVADIKRVVKGKVDVRSGFLSTYKNIMSEYAGAITTPEESILEEAQVYLQSRTALLTALVKQCIEGDYSGLRRIDKEFLWPPDAGQKCR